MLCHPAFRLPTSFVDAVDIVNTATDAAGARLNAFPTVLGDIVFDVDRAVRHAIDVINTRWIHALTMHDTFHPHVADDPSALHLAALAITHDTVNMGAPLALAAIVARVSNLKELVQTWYGSMEHIGIHAHFSASLKLLEACYTVVRSAAERADLIIRAHYTSESVVIPSRHECELSLESVNAIFHLLEDDLQVIYMSSIKPVLIEEHTYFQHHVLELQSEHVTPTYDGFESLGAIGSEPNFELACHLAHAVRTPAAKLCSNCRENPVAVRTRCFTDWCRRCDYTLWISRPRTDGTCLNLPSTAVANTTLPASLLNAVASHASPPNREPPIATIPPIQAHLRRSKRVKAKNTAAIRINPNCFKERHQAAVQSNAQYLGIMRFMGFSK